MTKGTLSMQAVKVRSSNLVKYSRKYRTFQGIPGLAVSCSGILWATWYSGGETECEKNFVLVCSSNDDGRTWSEPQVVIDPPETVRAFDPVLWIDPLDRLWLFWAQSDGENSIFDGVGGVWGICKTAADNLAMDWTEPRRIANGIMMNKPTVLSSGEWAMPTAVWNDICGKVPEELQNEKKSNVVISTDNGESFIYRGGADIPDRCFDEHMVVELADGRLWMLVRTNYGIGQSFSCDDGENWSSGENSGIRGPNSRFFIRRLKSGRLLLVNHNSADNEECKRSKLTAWLSDDDGKSWYGELLLDSREGVSYPDGQEDANGNIYIIYDHQRYKAGDILLARFREEDVIEGKCSSPGSFLQRLVDSSGGVKQD